MNSRKITSRHKGSAHGFIRRMVSPGDLGNELKPFVFLDYIHGHVPQGAGFGFHPHSGIATLTYQLDADISYEDTAGQKGTVEASGLEWMRAGGGTWHQGFIHPRAETVTGFQLWVALPPSLEDGASEGIYVPPQRVPQIDKVRVLLGTYHGIANPIPPPSPMTYLDVVLDEGQSWTFTPPEDQSIAWVFVYRGTARVCGEDVSSELVILNPSTAEVRIEANGPSRVLFGCARSHDHPLVLGTHSVHTNERSLAAGIANIRAIGTELRQSGRL